MCKKPIASTLLVYLVSQLMFLLVAISAAVIDQYQNGHRYAASIMPYIGRLYDLAGLLAFGIVLFHVASVAFLNWKWRYATTLTLALLYVSSYSALSYHGKYHGSRSGLLRWNEIGLSVVDQQLWQPKGVFWQPFFDIVGKKTYQATTLGYFYSPLICIDRAYVHPTVKSFDDSFNKPDGRNDDLTQASSLK